MKHYKVDLYYRLHSISRQSRRYGVARGMAGMVRTRLFPPLVLLLLLLPLLPAALKAETILMKNGDSFQAKIISQDRNSVTIQTETGRRVILKKEIKRIGYQDVETRPSPGIEKKPEEVSLPPAKPTPPPATKSVRESETFRAEMGEEGRLWERMHMDIPQEQGAAADALPVAAPVHPASSPARHWNFDGSALWRSALIPGWGEYHNDHQIKGAVLFGGIVLGGVAYRSYAEKAASTRDSYNKTNTLFLGYSMVNAPLATLGTYNLMEANAQRASLDRFANTAMKASLFLGLLYIYNVVDAAFFSHRQGRAATPLASNTGFAIGPTFTSWMQTSDPLLRGLSPTPAAPGSPPAGAELITIRYSVSF